MKTPKSSDFKFEIKLLNSRLDTLLPVLESTERAIRIESSINKDNQILKIMGNLEELGLKIWNLIDHFNDDDVVVVGNAVGEKDEDENRDSLIFCKVRYFVCLLLSIYYMILKVGGLRIIKCLLRSYYECVDLQDLDLENKFKDYIEKIIQYFENDGMLNDDEITNFNNMKIEFLILDMHSSIINNNLSMAKYYESKANLLENFKLLKRENIFNLLRTIFNDGLMIFKEDKFNESYYFFEKCYLVLEKLNIENNESELKIRFNCLTMLIKSCIKINSLESIDKATKLIKVLSNNNKDKNRIEAFKLQLELINYQKLIPEEIEDSIMKLIIGLPSNIEILNSIRIILNEFSNKEGKIAKNCLFYIFNNKLNFNDLKFLEISEQYLISLVWVIVQQIKDIHSSEKLKMVKNVLEIGDKKIIKELSKDTINCLIIMIWSQGKKRMKDEQFSESIEWFESCFMRLLINNEDSEIYGKIQRSMLQCCLKINDYKTFEEIFSTMNDKEKKNGITLYYKYSYLINNGKNNELIPILNELNKLENSKSINLLALCVIESKDKCIEDNVLRVSIEKLMNRCYKGGDTEEYKTLLIVALRTCIFIYCKNIENGIDIEYSIDMIIKCIDKFIDRNCDNLTEIEWFSSNVYNLGLKLIESDTFWDENVKLFGKVIQMLKDVKGFKEWKNKSILLKCFCQRQINSDWNEIYRDTEKLDATDEEDKIEIRMLNTESMIKLGKWNVLLKRIRQEDTKKLEIKLIIEKIVEVVKVNAGNPVPIRELFDIIFIEKLVSMGNDKNDAFEWLYIMLTNLLGEDSHDELLKCYVDLYNDLPGEVGESEQNWLGGVCWNRGIETVDEDKRWCVLGVRNSRGAQQEKLKKLGVQLGI